MTNWIFLLLLVPWIFLHKRIALLLKKPTIEEWNFLSCVGLILPSLLIYSFVVISAPIWVPSYFLYKTIWK
jgi:hypothetical protein